MKFYDPVALEEATNEIRRYYAIGRNLVAWDSEGLLTDAALFGKKRYGLSHYAASMAMQFAKEYSADEIDKLCKLCREYQCVPGLSLIRMLLESVKNKADRQLLQLGVIACAWTHRQLRSMINQFPKH